MLNLCHLLSITDSLSPLLPYIIPTLAHRLNCHDLEGVLHLPEVQRPPPSAKPMRLVKMLEPTQEIRLQLVNMLKIVIQRIEDDDFIQV